MYEGLYEQLRTRRLDALLATATDMDESSVKVDDADQPVVLARLVGEALVSRLRAAKDPDERIVLANQLLELLIPFDELITSPVRQLMSLNQPVRPGHATRSTNRPAIPLSSAALLTNSRGEPSLGTEVRAELESADRVDLLCAFVKWHGIRILEQQLASIKEREVPFRVISTTYMGATERRALDRLVRDFGAEVRIQYDNASTRLHAKAWLFRRNTGFDTGYVGSSNLSRAALLDGVEWNVRLSSVATPDLIEKFEGTFDTYWHDRAFEPYDPDKDGDRLDDALAEAGSGGRPSGRITLGLSGLEVRPYPFQAEMLQALDVERKVHDRHRNLVVAATGTGKTVVAALDYRAMCVDGRQPRLLFVAHRREILEQSLRTFREVLADGNFGELWVGDARPERWSHVFASIQSLHSWGVANVPADSFDIVIIDEFHHAEAASYRRVLAHFQPKELVGLTATPERTDGLDVLSHFGGRIAVELRLWDALNAELLCPFHYFGIADGTDLTGLAWRAGHYDVAALDGVYTGNDARARIILKQLQDKVADVSRMRALGFCVSVSHANYMARVFNEAGLPARAISATSSKQDRDEALASLRAGTVKALFAVDLFNEGIDLPDVDTVMFLRPTESATVFLQQLGRGLRRSPNKAVLTVLDFVGHQRKEFRFDLRLRALTGAGRGELKDQIEQGFPFLPSGCQIILDRMTQRRVLDNVKQQLTVRRSQLISDLREFGDIPLDAFIRKSGLDLSEVLKGTDRGWTNLRREAQLPARTGSPAEAALLKRVRAFSHVDDADRASAYKRLLSDSATHYSALDTTDRAFARMLLFSLYPTATFDTPALGLAALRTDYAVRDEIAAVVGFAFDQAKHLATPVKALPHLPLRVHARYSREEIVAATSTRVPGHFREGVLWSESLQADILFVNLQKSESGFSPSTMYRDYAISPTLFHWESQSTTSIDSPTGQRYLHHDQRGSHVLLFSREQKTYELGTAPYMFLGTAHYLSHLGERPIAVTWRLDVPMPPDAFRSATLVAG